MLMLMVLKCSSSNLGAQPDIFIPERDSIKEETNDFRSPILTLKLCHFLLNISCCFIRIWHLCLHQIDACVSLQQNEDGTKKKQNMIPQYSLNRVNHAGITHGATLASLTFQEIPHINGAECGGETGLTVSNKTTTTTTRSVHDTTGTAARHPTCRHFRTDNIPSCWCSPWPTSWSRARWRRAATEQGETGG